MKKNAAYQESMIHYNEEMIRFMRSLERDLKHPKVRELCQSTYRRFEGYLNLHRKALVRVKTEEAEKAQVVHRSAETGRFVTEDFAEDNPATTVEETVDTSPDYDEVPRASGSLHSTFSVEQVSDPELAAEPVDAGVATEETEDERNARLFSEAQAKAAAAEAKKDGDA